MSGQREDGEVEDGEVPARITASAAYPASNGSAPGTFYGSSGPPKLQVGLAKAGLPRATARPSVFDVPAVQPSSSGNGSGASGFSIKGAAAGGSQSSKPLDAPGASNQGLNIKGRSSNADRDGSAINGRTADSSTGMPASSSSGLLGRDTPSGLNVKGISSTSASGSGTSAARPSMALPFKPKASAVALPFKSKGAGLPPRPLGGMAAVPMQTHDHPQAPSNAIGKGYGNAMLVPKMEPPPSQPPEHASYTPPPRQQPPPPPPPSSQSRQPSPPSYARPPSPPAPPSSISVKGKGREEQSDYHEETREEGEEVEEDGEVAGTSACDEDSRPSSQNILPRSPELQKTRTRSPRASNHGRHHDDDDRARGDFGRSQAYYEDDDRYGSPRHHRHDYYERDYRRSHRDRYDDRYYESSSSSRRREDDRHSRRTGRDTYEPSHDRSCGHDRYRERERGRDHDAKSRESQRRRRDREAADDDRWARGSSISDSDGEYDRSRREPDFHDEPGAPPHPVREPAERKSLPATPSLPVKPGTAVAASKHSSSRVHAPPPVPGPSTPFFLNKPEVSHIQPSELADDSARNEGILPIVNGEDAKSASKSQMRRIFTLFGASRLSDYALEEKLGEGTFGVVHKARRKEGTVGTIDEAEMSHRYRKLLKRRKRQSTSLLEASAPLAAAKVKPGDVVALKKIVMHNDMDGVPITALREIRILKSLQHPNVVPVVDMAYQSGDHNSLRRGTIYMVFPYMAHDLAGLLENKGIERLEPSLLKLYARQLLLGTSYLHRNKILHRDMKAANLLLSDDGVLQIADFGLARSIEGPRAGRPREYTNCVVTRWYRPPELLLGLRAYGPPIDMWGVGCVIGEMFFRHPVFTGSNDLDQVARIVQMCGSIDDNSMPGWDKLPESKTIQFQRTVRNVKREFSRFSDELADLLDKLLVYDPEQRMTADQALDHDWFWIEPLPAVVGSVRAFPSSHEYDKRKAAEERQGHGGERARAAQQAAFTGPNAVVRSMAVPAPAPGVQHPQQQQGLMPQQVAQHYNQWQQPMQQRRQQAQLPMQMPRHAGLPSNPGLPPRPTVPQGLGLPAAPQSNGIQHTRTGGPGGMQYGDTSSGRSHVRPHEQSHYPVADKALSIVGRGNGWDDAEQANKRARHSPPRQMNGIAGRSRGHAERLAGQQLGLQRNSSSASAYEESVPAGSFEPAD